MTLEKLHCSYHNYQHNFQFLHCLAFYGVCQVTASFKILSSLLPVPDFTSLPRPRVMVFIYLFIVNNVPNCYPTIFLLRRGSKTS